MDSNTYFLITILYGDTLMKCALRVSCDRLTGDCAQYPMEPENRKQLHDLLPDYIKECGPIVDVQDLFSVTVVK